MNKLKCTIWVALFIFLYFFAINTISNLIVEAMKPTLQKAIDRAFNEVVEKEMRKAIYEELEKAVDMKCRFYEDTTPELGKPVMVIYEDKEWVDE